MRKAFYHETDRETDRYVSDSFFFRLERCIPACKPACLDSIDRVVHGGSIFTTKEAAPDLKLYKKKTSTWV